MAENIEETSYDILEWFPILVCQNVFSYLDGKDVIQASAVNKQWYEFTAEGQQARKIKLIFRNIDEHQLTSESMSILKASKRKYQNIEFDNISYKESGNFISLLADRAGLWKSFVSKRCCMPDGDIWPQIFRIIEPSVEEFSITSIKNINSLQVNQAVVDSNWIFPRLKFLECVDSGWKNYFKYFIRCTTLDKFYFPLLNAEPKVKRDIMTILHNNRNLKEISTKSYALFDYSFEFRLQKFSAVSEYGNALMNRNLFSFLRTHAQTLESLEINLKLDKESLELILRNMPRLSSFTTSFSVIRDAMKLYREQPFPVNSSITTLELRQEIPEREQNSLGTMIRALTNLKRFKCYDISNETFLTLVQHAPGLESLETHDFNISQVPGRKIFLSLKTFTADAFNKSLRNQIGYERFAMLVNAGMRNQSVQTSFQNKKRRFENIDI